MKKNLLFAGVFAVIITVSFLQFGCSTNHEPKQLTKEELVARGKYIVTTGGCSDCHSPKVFSPAGMEPDTTRLLSGHPADMPMQEFDPSMVKPGMWYLANSHLTGWVGPWGISYASNLTPDKATGIGALSEEMFIKTLREGKYMGVGRPLLPPMPWQTIGQMTDEDLKAVYSYLMTLKPISNKVPDPVPPTQFASANK